ncbi:hypothetical protein KI387_039738, partial [Taxus chinensis]
MLQGPAAYFSAPVYGHSHYKKFWLKKMETEDDSAVEAAPPLAEGGGGVLLTNCSALDMKGTSPLPLAIRAVAPAPAAAEKQIKNEVDYTLALGVGDSKQVEEEDMGFSRRAEKFDKFAVDKSSAMEPSIYTNDLSSRAVMKMCADCKTVKTPLWRNGPRGPKSLCNACGIRYKKMGKRPSSPSTPPISSSGKSKIHGKRENIYGRQQGKKIRNLGGGRSSMGPRCLQAEGDIANYGEGNRSWEALRRWRQVERIRKPAMAMAKDEEEGA